MEKETAAAAAAVSGCGPPQCWVLGFGCWVLPGPRWRVEVGRKWTVGFSILSDLVGWRSGPLPRVADLVEPCRRAGGWLGNCSLWDAVRTCWVKLDIALDRFGSRGWGEDTLVLWVVLP